MRDVGKKDTDMPQVSVVMAVYNMGDGQVLETAVSSIQSQTYKDWELIICDDGSTDCTWEVLRRIARDDPRIRLIRNVKNRKAAYARNACIKKSCGRYIAVMDADDISAPCRLEKEYEYLESHPQVSFVGSRGEFFVHNVGDDGELYWFCREPGARDFLFSLPFVHASIMFRREALEQAGGYACAGHAVRVEDYDLLLRLYSMGYRGANLPEVLYYIRRDNGQYRRRKYRYRFHEAYMKCRNFKELGLMPEGLAYAVKPLLVGLVPARFTAVLQKKYYMRNER